MGLEVQSTLSDLYKDILDKMLNVWFRKVCWYNHRKHRVFYLHIWSLTCDTRVDGVRKIVKSKVPISVYLYLTTDTE